MATRVHNPNPSIANYMFKFEFFYCVKKKNAIKIPTLYVRRSNPTDPDIFLYYLPATTYPLISVISNYSKKMKQS